MSVLINFLRKSLAGNVRGYRSWHQCQIDLNSGFTKLVGYSPSRSGVDIGVNNVHKLLFAMAADDRFLVADRFDAWALDLATAALAMHARALTVRRNTFGARLGPEFHYWEALEMIFFRDEDSEAFIIDAIRRAMDCSGQKFSMRSFEILLNVGQLYKSAIAKLGVNSEYVVELAARCWEMHPIVYNGGCTFSK